MGPLIVAADLAGAFFLSCYAVVTCPIAFFPRIFAFRQNLRCVRLFAPFGLLTALVQTSIDWRFGRISRLITEIEGMIASFEPLRGRVDGKFERHALMALYLRLVQAYMISGQIEDAINVVMRAHASLGIERLPGLGELNHRTAQILRAGIAASRMMESGGLAALFLKPMANQDLTGRTSGGTGSGSGGNALRRSRRTGRRSGGSAGGRERSATPGSLPSQQGRSQDQGGGKAGVIGEEDQENSIVSQRRSAADSGAATSVGRSGEGGGEAADAKEGAGAAAGARVIPLFPSERAGPR